MRLLVVDDNTECRAMAVRLLACLGHDVMEAGEAGEAEALFTRERGAIELVLVDLFLGSSDGVTLATRLESLHAGLRVLFMSGHGEATREMADLEGARRQFLEKPFSLPALEAALESLSRCP